MLSLIDDILLLAVASDHFSEAKTYFYLLIITDRQTFSLPEMILIKYSPEG